MANSFRIHHLQEFAEVPKNEIKEQSWKTSKRYLIHFISEIKWNSHDNHSGQNDMAFVDRRMKMRKDRNLESITQHPTLMESLQEDVYLPGP